MQLEHKLMVIFSKQAQKEEFSGSSARFTSQILQQNNPSVSFADSSLYTREPLKSSPDERKKRHIRNLFDKRGGAHGVPPLSLSKYDFFAEIPPHERGTCEQDAPHIRI